MITDTAEYMIVTNHLGSPVQVIDVNSGVIVYSKLQAILKFSLAFVNDSS